MATVALSKPAEDLGESRSLNFDYDDMIRFWKVQFQNHPALKLTENRARCMATSMKK